MIRFLLIAILLLLIARVFWKMFDSVMEAAGGTPRSKPRKPAVRLVRDPVCGTHVAPGTALSITSGGSTHYFCSEQCRAEYRKHS